MTTEISPKAITKERVVRVFISSTFRDMHAERDHLVTVVFPDLRERVESLGLEFFDVDLRWGVPEKGADGEKTNSWEYCRQWIDRVEPLFVCILGQRYGWVPKVEDFRDNPDKARQALEPRSITDLEVRHAVLDSRRKRRSYFYLRATDAPATASDYVDLPPLSDKLEQLKADVRSCGRPVRDYPCEWVGDRFAKLDAFGKMVLEDLWSGVLRDERYVSKNVWRQVLGADFETDPRYTDESQPIPCELWEKIVVLAKPLLKDPLDAEREQMEAFAASRLKWFQGRTKELKQLTDFVNSTDENVPRLAVVAAVPGQGKSALIAKLVDSLSRPEVRDLRSEVSQKAEKDGQSQIENQKSEIFLIAHFVGATERSASAHALVQRLLDELDSSGIVWPAEERKEGEEPKLDFESLCIRLAQRLGDYAGERRIVILLDALNQLSDGHDLNWLPHRLGPSLRVVVSCIEDVAQKSEVRGQKSDGNHELTPEQRVLRALAAQQPAPLCVLLGPLTEEDVRTILVEYLKEYCKELDTPHVNAICRMEQARNPLYLLVLLGELRTLGGNDMNRIVGERIAALAHDYPDTVSLFRWVLQRLEVFGQEAVQWWCLYLAHGRAGMASHELADLLARKLGADAAATALLIERGLRRYLLRRGGQLDFFHGQLRQAVMEQYGAQAETTTVHADIATYFRDQADPEKNQTWKGDSPRPFLEVVFHLVGAERSDDYCQTLCDLRFVEARCRVAQVFELIADYRLAQEHLPEAQADMAAERQRQERIDRWTRESIAYSKAWSDRRDRQARGEVVTEPEPELPEPPLSCRMWTEEEIDVECERIIRTPTRRDRLEAFAGFVGSQCYPLHDFDKRIGFVAQYAANYASAGPVPDAANAVLSTQSIPAILRRWSSQARPNPRPACLRTLEGHSGSVTSVSVTPDGQRAVSGSHDATVRVWDLESGECVRTLEGHSEIVYSVSVTPDGLRAISGSRDATVRVWDLESGECVRTLEGHSGSVISVSVTPDGLRAVSGSEDKTVRVWDLESGECVRTLEGHSSGVESVSVTPDGLRAVSGGFGWDETVRVWDLESGKCLRILKGYRFNVLSLSMTPDGLRAISGSWDKTVRVWDLESGKCLRVLEGHSERVESVSVTPDGLRAISGSRDGTVRVWDLESGECLRTLEGHSGSVNSVSLTPDGLRAVSGSDDKTLRVWDLDSGKCLGVYCADAPVSASAIFSGKLVIGLKGREVLFADMLNFPSGPAILTAANPQQARCPMCGQEFVPPPLIVAAIKERSQPASLDGYAVPRETEDRIQKSETSISSSAYSPQPTAFLSPCPHCQHPLQFNPFFSAAEDYADVLRRGLVETGSVRT